VETSRSIWDMGQLPFNVGPLPGPESDRFPTHLPFRVGFEDALGLFTQMYDPHVMEVLRQVYAEGVRFGVPMGDQGLGKAYAQDFQGVLEDWLGDVLEGAALLEIGCGAGHLLSALADSGADVAGVEPDPRAKVVMAERGIPVTTCNFEDFRPSRTYDCIVHYGVLEHAVDPVAFMLAQKDLLNPDGRIVCAVPDCGSAIEDGDISIFIHQHWSYFTATSLRRLAATVGLRVEAECRANVGGLLYMSMAHDPGGATTGEPSEEGASVQFDPGEFVERARRSMARLDAYVQGAAAAGTRLGLYCPGRTINYVPEHDDAWRSVRLFDDSPRLTGKYLPPFRSVVENGEGLERQGVDEVLIMSRAFGAAIEAAIEARPLDPAPRIRHIGDVLSHD